MSELAPFVAACIRDKVVLDLLEENKMLRKLIEKYHSVRLTGSSGYPVYSNGKIDIDAPCESSCNHTWQVSLLQNCGCKLNDLLLLEIWKFGAVTKLVDLEECWGFIDTCSISEKSIVVLTAGVGLSHIEIGICVEGMPEERWQSLHRLTGSDFINCLTTACSSNVGTSAYFQYIMIEDERN
jgi:hypothetical protein